MPWLQLSVSAEPTHVAAIEHSFETLGALCVSYGDAGDQALLEPAPGETRLWKQTKITALFDGASNAAALRAALQTLLSAEVFASLQQQWLKYQLWERAWMDDFHPMRFGQRLWVCPDGQRPDTPGDSVYMDLDPGLAFGSGTHPSTALCLQWIDQAELTGKAVLDYGCGSGILAIAAALLGARAVAAVDYDPQALQATAENAAKNGVAHLITPLAPSQTPAAAMDLVLANILAGTLVSLAPQLIPRVVLGGHLVLAGILQEQAEQVIAAYQGHFLFSPPWQQQEWILLHGIKTHADTLP